MELNYRIVDGNLIDNPGARIVDEIVATTVRSSLIAFHFEYFLSNFKLVGRTKLKVSFVMIFHMKVEECASLSCVQLTVE